MVAEYKGYEDNGKTVLKCLGCGRSLMTVFDVGGEVAKSRKVKAKCGICGDVSDVYESIGDIKLSVGNNGESADFDRIALSEDENEEEVLVLAKEL